MLSHTYGAVCISVGFLYGSPANETSSETPTSTANIDPHTEELAVRTIRFGWRTLMTMERLDTRKRRKRHTRGRAHTLCVDVNEIRTRIPLADITPQWKYSECGRKRSLSMESDDLNATMWAFSRQGKPDRRKGRRVRNNLNTKRKRRSQKQKSTMNLKQKYSQYFYSLFALSCSIVSLRAKSRTTK